MSFFPRINYLLLFLFRSELRADTKSQEHAEILKRSLSVDKVLYPERGNREITVDGSTLKVFEHLFK